MIETAESNSIHNQDLFAYLPEHLEENFPEDKLSRIRQQFSRDGFMKISDLVPAFIKNAIHSEARKLSYEYGERRDLKLKTTGNTPRYLNIVRSYLIAEKGEVITSLAHHSKFVRFLESIFGERIFPAPQLDEEYVITRQEKAGDTHGWHWGDYSYSLIWIVETPPIEFGGMLQCIPHTCWDKTNPKINQYLTERSISTYGFESGDIYLLKADTTLHRTVPLTKDGRTRIMLNMTWGNKRDLTKPMEFDDRWWDNVNATEASHEASPL